MRVKGLVAAGLLAIGLCGCGGPGLGSQGDANHWAEKLPAGQSEEDANHVLADNGFGPWSTGRVVYGYRDTVVSSDYSDGVATQSFVDQTTGKVSSTETFASPVTPFPLLEPTYP